MALLLVKYHGFVMISEKSAAEIMHSSIAPFSLFCSCPDVIFVGHTSPFHVLVAVDRDDIHVARLSYHRPLCAITILSSLLAS